MLSAAMLFRVSLLLALLVAAPVAAQHVDTLAVAPGSRLRVTTHTGARLPTGSLTRQTPDSLFLFLECRTCSMSDSAVAWHELRTVERYAGRSHGKGALIGMGIGLLAGTAVGAIGAKSASNDCLKEGGDFCGLSALLVPIGSVIGLVGGVVVGAIVGTDRWVRVWPDTPNR
jgi:hypothetical protein